MDLVISSQSIRLAEVFCKNPGIFTNILPVFLIAIAPSPCKDQPCQNGGTCIEINDGVTGTTFFVCQCPDQWTGQRCDQREYHNA